MATSCSCFDTPPRGVLGKEQRRSYFHFAVDGVAPDGEWIVKIDNHRFRLFWALLTALPALVEPQGEWLKHVWDSLLDELD